MTEVVQCEFCGRVRRENEWVHAPGAVPTYVGCCVTCGPWLKRVQRVKEADAARKWRAEQPTVRSVAVGPDDPFRGFREP